MEIEPLDKKTVKIVLSKQDMVDFSLTYEDMDYNDPATKKIILSLLNEIKEKNKLNLLNGRLFIEAFPKDDGGCILYLNLVSVLKNDLKTTDYIKCPIIATTKNPYHLILLCKTLYKRFDHIILKSHLYFDNLNFYLFLYSFFKQDNRLCSIVQEFAKLGGKGVFDGSLIKEHSKLIVKDNAIKTIAFI